MARPVRSSLGVSVAATMTVLALAVAGTALSPKTASAGPKDTAMAMLEEMGMAGEMESMQMVRQRNASRGSGSTTRGYQAWTRLESCSGFLVVNTTAGGVYRDSFTTGSCQAQQAARY